MNAIGRSAKANAPTGHETLLRDLLQAVYWFDEGLQAHMEAAGWPRMSRTKSMILTNMANGVTRPSKIAENLGLTRQAVHLALSELQTQAVVVMMPDPDDRRAKIATFAPHAQGQAIRGVAVASLHRIEGVLAERLGEDLFTQLTRAMRADWQSPVMPDSASSP